MKILSTPSLLFVWLVHLTLCAPLVADNTGSLVLTPIFKVGDTYTVLTEKTRATTHLGNYPPAPTLSWENTVEVVEKINRGYVIAWTRGDLRVVPPQQTPPESAWMVDIWEHARFELIVSPEGHVIDVRNYEDLCDRFKRTVNKVQNASGVQGADPTSVEQANALVKTTAEMMLTDRSRGIAFLTRDIAGMYGYHMRDLYLNEPTEYEVNIPTPIGGQRIPGAERWEFMGWSDDQTSARFRWSQEMDREKLQEVVTSLIEQLSPIEQEQQEAYIEALRGLNTTVTGQLTYVPSTGRVTQVSITREHTVGKDGRRETWAYTIKD